MSKINIPSGAKQIINTLNDSGFEAYVVGGCVRDSILGMSPKDWDICTSATPDEMKACLEFRTIDTGLKHGTITVVIDNDTYEVTTFRKDGDYSDNRHPDSVEFVLSLEEDLARRDFTINAMAYNETVGLIDKFGGLNDLNHKIISCVGNPDDRFNEDALRIMRAMRFASTYEFSIQKETAQSIHSNKDMLLNIANERIQTELVRMLCGDGILNILLNFNDVITTIIPEMKPCVGFDQKNRFHQYTIYEHIAHAVSNYTGMDTSVNVALLLHDIGKPQCYSEDENGGHFHGHSVPSHEITEAVLDRLRFDNKTKREVSELVLFHDSYIDPTPKSVKKWLNKIGEERFRQLIQVKRADISAHKQGTFEARIIWCNSLLSILENVIKEKDCFTIKDLNIDGFAIMALGVSQGKIVGDILNHLLDKVINGEIKNDISDLIDEAGRYIIYGGKI